jgi:hypothetical protein
MLNVLLYTTQPILALGLSAAFEEGDCHLASVCSTTPLPPASGVVIMFPTHALPVRDPGAEIRQGGCLA